MFEQYAGYFWAAFFSALVFYTLWRNLGAPYLVRRFYALNQFVDQGKSDFDESPYADSILLKRLNARNIHSGEYENYPMEQFAAYPQSDKKRTLGRVKGIRHQVVWTVTVLHTGEPLDLFCARPARTADSLEYLVDLDNVIFQDDEFFTKKIHVVADNHAWVQRAFTADIREHLDNIDPVSLESTGSVLILKSPRQPHDTGGKLKSELDTLARIYQSIVCINDQKTPEKP